MRLLILALLALPAFDSIGAAQEPKKDLPAIVPIDLKRKDPVEYGADIEPIFRAKCFVCHTGNVTEGKFDMSTLRQRDEGRRQAGGQGG